MRQQQQRSRNRNRGRKSTNPLSRNFESNGPDVKIRGNASHIAEKYSVLARDALTSSDTVMAENYFQHAEHYFRIVASAQQNAPQNNAPQGNQQNREGNRNSSDNNRGESNGDGPQPELENMPAEVALKPENTGGSSSGEESKSTASEEPERPRRNGRRPANNRRTSRVSASKDDESSDSATSSATSSDGDGLSKDAASLPTGLIGKSGEIEKPPLTTEE